mmetsp:Transcript_27983/g.76941  ORF Transcript_27983/g.76941 Transcript_27983/m.76941 type:complete len:438 (-) Transcript_27983:671-1984(-)
MQPVGGPRIARPSASCMQRGKVALASRFCIAWASAQGQAGGRPRGLLAARGVAASCGCQSGHRCTGRRAPGPAAARGPGGRLPERGLACAAAAPRPGARRRARGRRQRRQYNGYGHCRGGATEWWYGEPVGRIFCVGQGEPWARLLGAAFCLRPSWLGSGLAHLAADSSTGGLRHADPGQVQTRLSAPRGFKPGRRGGLRPGPLGPQGSKRLRVHRADWGLLLLRGPRLRELATGPGLPQPRGGYAAAAPPIWCHGLAALRRAAGLPEQAWQRGHDCRRGFGRRVRRQGAGQPQHGRRPGARLAEEACSGHRDAGLLRLLRLRGPRAGASGAEGDEGARGLLEGLGTCVRLPRVRLSQHQHHLRHSLPRGVGDCISHRLLGDTHLWHGAGGARGLQPPGDRSRGADLPVAALAGLRDPQPVGAKGPRQGARRGQQQR